MPGFDRYLKDVLDRAGQEARLDGSTTVEAHHLLLAIAADPASSAGGALASAGLGRAAIREALDREYAHSLSMVGVSASAFDAAAATPDPDRRPHPGASVRLTLERALQATAGTQPQPLHLLVAILQADVGTVPRALALAGVDRTDLVARIQTMTGPAKH
ncbi:hypothetical protein GCM10022225_80100 [Plantactinospora mayteni]|uniref:Clp R domain-containing protein n=1 Tax=Plantactinospora mayteni TaxID=566021 RepID=A0ABQ4F376_9ACTN|nr:Clp protease N-terminal domain-containing protein [Plantactinospora mayteni]GIH01359.1 hypothetical protein Pma05_79310 [Plantactinospora mayteni]